MDLEGKRILQPESLENIKHHIPQREFWACIYLKEFMEKAHVRFFEYREQEVETAFRFRAFSRTKRIQRRADVVWVWHRNNPDSNVNTWNLVTLCRVKSLIYLELFKEYTAGDASVSEHLYGVYLEFFRKFMAHLKEQGPPEQANMRDYRRQIVILSKGLSLGKHISQNDEYRQFSTWAQRLKYPFKARLLLAAIGKKRNATHGRPKETNRRFFNSRRRKGI